MASRKLLSLRELLGSKDELVLQLYYGTLHRDKNFQLKEVKVGLQQGSTFLLFVDAFSLIYLRWADDKQGDFELHSSIN